MVMLNLLDTELSGAELENQDLLRAQIIEGFGYASTEAVCAINGLLDLLLKEGVFFDHILSEGWQKRARACPIQVAGANSNRLGEISVAISDELLMTLPPGMLADFDQSVMEC